MSGILAYQVALEEQVAAGQVIAEVIDPTAAPGAARLPIRAETPGIIFTLRANKLMLAHHPIAKIAGQEALAAGSGL